MYNHEEINLTNTWYFKVITSIFFSNALLHCMLSEIRNRYTFWSVEPADPMVGVWEQIQSCFLVNGDTVEFNNNSVHHKIYLDGYVIWNSDPAEDSSEWHGYGTYRFNNDTLIEELLSMSQSMQDLWGADMEAILKIEFKENTFKQMQEHLKFADFLESIYTDGYLTGLND